jgi:hypothetical protein
LDIAKKYFGINTNLYQLSIYLNANWDKNREEGFIIAEHKTAPVIRGCFPYVHYEYFWAWYPQTP